MTRVLVFVCIVTAFVYAWSQFNEIPLFVVGQPSSTGLLQKSKEAPFFSHLSAVTQIPFNVVYKPLEEVGFKDTYQLQMLKDGIYDLVSLRFIQNSEIEPSLQGIDLVGLISDAKTARKVIEAYSDTIDGYLQEKFNAKLLGIWTFGPQEIFCIKPIHRLEDIKNMKVRVASNSLSGVISNLGGVPVIISFEDTKDALAKGIVDCAVTSAASANFAGWVEYTKFYFPLALQYGLNGYAISLNKWHSLSPKQQKALKKAFDSYLSDLWEFSQAMYADMLTCHKGADCKYGKTYNLIIIEPTDHDIQLLREDTVKNLLPEWGARCEKVHPGCVSQWKEKVEIYLQPPAGQQAVFQTKS